ncbi:MAG: radical SAM protein [Lachnospiraceae bacterium]|nr:radical SAM protein [Lachnospiraceae bacterium]MCH4029979.1 radical SAM protein [Lachnospiraceae bacterium]MCH4070360.1 radical SAM protein [Lachnospiraceae bacterium]MCI1331587.1 radical SAM protein [Lachnospiraceae bacterium]MCI1361034.1 radical SAM protein [Lachnospiraceae bacterium]
MNGTFFEPAFSHVYVEERAADLPQTKRILQKLPDAHVIMIRHYKDVFNFSGQDARIQSRSLSLILADEPDPRVYRGAPVCQDFGNKAFYYTSTVMNCVYDCEYCYLKGMYPSANLVVFTDQSRTFAEVDRLLALYPVYLCISYDTDLAAIEPLTGFLQEWYAFAAERPDLTLEIRTKCANKGLLSTLPALSNAIWAFTLSPDAVADRYEKKAPGLSMRIAAARLAVSRGIPVRLCFDPMLRFPGWEEEYRKLAQTVREAFKPGQIRDISIGSFRIGAQYLGQLRARHPDSALAQYPYKVCGGVAGYGEKSREMTAYMTGLLDGWIGRGKMFLWEEQEA